ncbi:spondin domain-containing protein [Crocosphaera sp. Alani8]|uniref:spondin domain-containing protein n=1 Tax=Crocosphaera sp. Alani8 TaxID=3038952 RepID=UPI00313CDAB2
MTNLLKKSGLLTLLTIGSVVATAATAQALTLKVEIENLGPDGGVALTPVWVGFHDGSFDIYNGGLTSQEGLERIAEDGNTMPISMDFLSNRTYVQNGVSGLFDSTQVGTRVDGAIGEAPITAGTMATSTFEVTPDNSNLYFSYTSMILPSNDYFLANADPLAHSLTTLFSGEDSFISFEIGLPGSFRDAGTEVNDFNTSAPGGDPNPLFPGLPPGQSGPNDGADENGVITSVTDSYADFQNRPVDFDTDFANLNFNNETLYPNGIARVTISVVEEVESVPESSTTVGLMTVGGLLFFAGLRRRNRSI